MAGTEIDPSTQRSLERVLKSSMDTHSLTNLVSSLRIPVKKAKVCGIHKITQQMKRIRKKMDVKPQQKGNENKIEQLSIFLQVIKKLNVDKVAKFALGNTLTLQDVASKYKNDVEMRCLVLLSFQKPLLTRVNAWRQDHPDWKTLAAFLVQHTGKRYNPKDITTERDIESKPKFKHQQREITAALKTIEDESKPNDNTPMDKVGKTEERTCDSLDSNNRSSLREKNMLKRKRAYEEDKNIASKIPKHNKEAEESTAMPQTQDSESDDVSKEENEMNDSSDQTENNIDSDSSVNEESIEDIPKYHKDHMEREILTVLRDAAEIEKDEGEVVVKRINLEQVANDDETEISFLFTGNKPKEHTESSKKTKTKKSSFFISKYDAVSQSDESDQEEEEEEEESGTSDRMGESDEEEDDENGGLLGAKKALHESTFMGSLSGPAPKFKDYVAYRKGKRIGGRPHQSYSKSTGKGEAPKKPSAKSLASSKYPKVKQSSVKSKQPLKNNKPAKPDKVQTTGAVKLQMSTTGGNLHPSWEASIKRKQQQSSIASFQGKKKTFDD